MTDLVVGIGEIGSAISKLLQERNFDVDEYDIRNPIILQEKYDFVHICFPDNDNKQFIKQVKRYSNFGKIIIHSTVTPGTSKKLDCIYSPVRGVHKTMLEDLKYYSKYYSGQYNKQFEQRFINCQIVKDSTKLELTKILVDTTYYGWEIVYTKIVDYNYDVEWSFAKEIHKKHGNRPIMYNDQQKIGGHCVIQNLDLLKEKNIITEIIKQGSEINGKKPIPRPGDSGTGIRKDIHKITNKFKFVIPLSVGLLIGIIFGVYGHVH